MLDRRKVSTHGTIRRSFLLKFSTRFYARRSSRAFYVSFLTRYRYLDVNPRSIFYFKSIYEFANNYEKLFHVVDNNIRHFPVETFDSIGQTLSPIRLLIREAKRASLTELTLVKAGNAWSKNGLENCASKYRINVQRCANWHCKRFRCFANKGGQPTTKSLL